MLHIHFHFCKNRHLLVSTSNKMKSPQMIKPLESFCNKTGLSLDLTAT